MVTPREWSRASADRFNSYGFRMKSECNRLGIIHDLQSYKIGAKPNPTSIDMKYISYPALNDGWETTPT